VIKKIPYKGVLPSALQELVSNGLMKRPKQYLVNLKWVNHIDIIYKLNWGPSTIRQYGDMLVLAALQDLNRYYNEYGKEVKFTGKLEVFIRGHEHPWSSWGLHTTDTPQALCYGPGYDTEEYWLTKALEAIFKKALEYKAKTFRLDHIVLTILERKSPITGAGEVSVNVN
jgi:hypothetical protein